MTVTDNDCQVTAFTAPSSTTTSVTFIFKDVNTGDNASVTSPAIPAWGQGKCTYPETLTFDPDLVGLKDSDYLWVTSFDVITRQIVIHSNENLGTKTESF